MKIHANARTTPKTRAILAELVLRRRWTKARAARAFHVSPSTAGKWVERYRAEGRRGLEDRSSAPHRIPHRTPAGRTARIARLRRRGLRMQTIAERLQMAVSTVSAVLRRIGLGRGWDRKTEPVVRYQWAKAGDLLHIDVKKFGRFRERGHRATGPGHARSRGVGWEFAYVCVDDASRLAYVELLENELAETADGFLRRALAWFRSQGIRCLRVMTDNGAPFRSKLWAATCTEFGLRHIRTRPYRPRTNGKAERFIQTLQREWAYGKAYETSAGRKRALPSWLRYYNERRPHRGLGMKPPLAALPGA